MSIVRPIVRAIVRPVVRQFGIGSSQSWSAYWMHQDEVLFFGEISTITDGKLYNQKAGATDFLTVGGVAGSYTFQAPNTAPYIAADTDYIWFKTDATPRTTTEAELIGYDFTRTIVKYEDISDYSIQTIMILSSDLDTAKMRNDFHLSIWWSNTSSDYGVTKGNRIGEQSVWTEESVAKVIDTFTDTDSTRLAVHESDTGGLGWTEVNGAWTINSGKVSQVTANSTNCYVTREIGAVITSIAADLTVPANQFAFGFVFRYQDTTNRWYCVLQRDAVQVYISLFLNATSKGSFNVSIASGVTKNIRITDDGTNIKVYYDNGTESVISVADTTLNDKTKAGLFTYNGGSYLAGLIDNLNII